MNYTDRNKILVGGFLVIIVVAAVVFMVIGSKGLLTIKQPEVSSSIAQSTPVPASQGQVLGDSIQNPLKDIYINPFAK